MMLKIGQKGNVTLLLVVVIAVIGVIFITSTFSFKSLKLSELFPKLPSFAAGSSVVVELEQATKTSPAALGSDTTASGGQYLTFNLPTGVNYLNVKTQYGALGDGVTDDTQEIQNAINAAGNITPKGIVVIAPGIYKISYTYTSCCTFGSGTTIYHGLEMKSGVELIGYGVTRSILKEANNFAWGVQGASNIKVRGFGLQGTNVDETSNNNSSCAYLDHGFNQTGGGSLIEDILTGNWGCGGLANQGGSNGNIFNHNVVHDAYSEGMTFYAVPGTSTTSPGQGSDDNFIEYNYSYHNKYNGIGMNGNRNYMRFNNLQDNGQKCISDPSHFSDCSGVLIYENGGFRGASDNVVEGNNIVNSAEYGLFNEGVNAAPVERNIFSNNTVTGGRQGIYVSGLVNGTKVIGNKLINQGKYGIFIDNANNGTYQYNEVSNTGGNTGSYQDGVTFWGTSSNNTFTSNNIHNNQKVGLAIRTDLGVPTGNQITNNYIYGNSPDILNQTTGNTISGTISSAPTLPLPKGPVSTTCPSYPTEKGVATITVNAPASGTYNVWVRIKSQDNISDSFYLQIDANCPKLMGNIAIPDNTWTWTNKHYLYNDVTSENFTINLNSGTHIVKLIGREANVKLDKLILTTDNACIPSGDGSNCSVVTPTSTPTTTPTVRPTPTSTPTPTPTSNPSSTPNPTPKPGDINGDGVVNVIDYGIFVTDFPTQNLRSDIDHDGRVTVIDYGIFVTNFGH